MGEHPYRKSSTSSDDERPQTSIEDHLVDLVVLVVGLIGVVIGVLRPDRAVELTLGIFLVVFVLKDGNWRLRR